jgi:hypothetical protein
MIRKIAFLLVLAMSLGAHTESHAFGLGSVGKGQTQSVDASALADQQSGLVNRLVDGFKEYTAGQAQVARALGLKEEAERLESEQEALASGNVQDKDGIERTMSVSSSAQEAIEEKMAESGEISAESKAEFSKAMPYYARGTAQTIKLLPEIRKWGKSASSAVKGAGMMNAGKIKKSLGTGLFLVKKLPGYVKQARKSYASLSAFSKKNEIDTSEADALLGDDL